MLLTMLAIAIVSSAQTITPIASGLMHPAGICKDLNGHLLVAEAGTGNNDGRISMVDSTGIINTVVYGLPSSIDTSTGEVSGPWRTIMMEDSMIMVIVGGGPDTLGGVDSVAGSILIYDMTGFTAGTDSMTVTDAVKILNIQKWVLNNGFTDSNIFSALWDSSSGNLYVVDAGANAVLRVDSAATISVVDTFPGIANPSGGIPPMIDYVPTDIVADSAGQLYVCNLSGFPFMPGLSQIVMVDTAGFNHMSQVTGLSQAVDMEMAADSGIYVLQFGTYDTTTFTPMANTASIVHATMSGMIDTVATGFGPSAGMTADWSNGFYVTELITGTVLHITDINTGIELMKPLSIQSLKAYPNPFENSLRFSYTLNENSNVTCELRDQLGKVILTKNIADNTKGNHSYEINQKEFDLSSLNQGIYYLTLSTQHSRQTVSVLRK
jgi:hypothetical protein